MQKTPSKDKVRAETSSSERKHPRHNMSDTEYKKERKRKNTESARRNRDIHNKNEQEMKELFEQNEKSINNLERMYSALSSELLSSSKSKNHRKQ